MTGGFRLLALVAMGDAQAAQDLGAWVLGLAVESHDQDEVRQRVAVKLLTDAEGIFTSLLDGDPVLCARAPSPAAVLELAPDDLSAADRRFAAYVRRMLHNTRVSLWRAGRREETRRDDQPSDWVSSGPDPDDLLLAGELLEAFENVIAGLPEATRAAIRQMEDLLDDQFDMADLVAEDLASRGIREPDQSQREASRGRIYKRHERARGSFERAVAGLQRAGFVPVAHCEYLIDWIRSLRRRIPSAQDVPDSGRT